MLDFVLSYFENVKGLSKLTHSMPNIDKNVQECDATKAQ
ncbi:hypothetical protein BH10BAC2_BH10BAC2_45480 [soil metagenome]